MVAKREKIPNHKYLRLARGNSTIARDHAIIKKLIISYFLTKAGGLPKIGDLRLEEEISSHFWRKNRVVSQGKPNFLWNKNPSNDTIFKKKLYLF